MPDRATDTITSWHAHVYFDASSCEVARALYERLPAQLAGAEIGRFHERPVGPHPMWSYQIAFPPALFGEIVPWLALNRSGLDVFVHPNTGDSRTDHAEHVLFLGRSYPLDLAVFDR